MDATAVTTLFDEGLETDKATTAAAVGVTANAVNRTKANNGPLTAHVPQMPHLILDTNLGHLSERSKIMTNVTCMRPTQLGLTNARMSYTLDRLTTRPTTIITWMDLSTIPLQKAGS